LTTHLRSILWCMAVLVALPIPTAEAAAQVRGEIVGAGASRMAIAVPDLRRLGGVDSAAGRTFIAALRRDLELSGLFQVLDPKVHPEDAQTGGTSREDIRFEAWESIGARGLLRGQYEVTPTGLNLELRFFDVAGRTLLGGRRLGGGTPDAARLAHRVADAYIEAITGKRGPFDSKLAFVSNRGGFPREIYAWSFDDRADKLTDHRSITMAPAWAPDSESVVFTSFRGGRPALYSVDLASRAEVRLAGKLGLNIGGAWSPDGKLMVLARENSGNTDLHVLDFQNEKQWQLTKHWGIDVGPAWSPDGRSLAFCSSRAGSPQIYIMEYASKALRRLTYEGNYNCSPAWSPDGKSIAYAGQVRGRFQVMVIAAAGGTARQVTFKGENEDPTWSPDSRYIAYSSKRETTKKIYMSDQWGRWETALTTGKGDESAPSWSRWLD
jgi:TolB protein